MLKKKESSDLYSEIPHEPMSLNILTLSYNKNTRHLEQPYRDSILKYSLKKSRITIVFGVVAFSLFGILDAFLVPELKYFFWILRFIIFAPFAICILLLSYHRCCQRIFQSLFLLLEILAGGLIIIMIIYSPPPVNYSYYAGLILVFMLVYTVSGMRFIWATTGSFILVLLYEIAAVGFMSTPFSILINNNFFFIGANFIGMIASYGIECTNRRNYFLNYLLKEEKSKVREANNILEEKVFERTERLEDEVNIRVLAEQKLVAMLEEKEVLLKELYHRTKNNMQIISSIISLESSNIEDTDQKEIFIKTELKIQAMAMVHEELYKSKDLTRVNFKNYIENIVPLMISSYSDSRTNVTLNLELDEVYIKMDSAIPCGLILSEFIINTMKHGFAESLEGVVSVKLSLLESGEIELILSDNGVGVDEDFDFRTQNSLGLETIFALGQHQLDGTVKMNGNNGLSLSLIFKEKKYRERV